MNSVSAKVGVFRSRLSAYLKTVRRGGEVVITDRDNPIGVVVPYRREGYAEPFEMSPPARKPEALAGLDYPPVKCQVDAVKVLLDDRRRP